MSSGPVLPTSPSPIAHKLTLTQNRQAENISAIPAIISKLQNLYYLPQIDI